MTTPPKQRSVLFLAIAIVLVCGMLYYVAHIWAAPPGTHFSDLYSSWHASHELLLHGRDPYSPAVTREAQIWRYGHPLKENAQSQQEMDRFVYPLYLIFILAPIARFPFSTAATIFRIVLPGLAVVSVPLWLSALRWRCTRIVALTFILLALGSFPVLESVYLQQLALLAAALLSGACAALCSGRMALAGALFALTTIKPQLSCILIVFLLIWAFWDWRTRKNLLLGFGLTMVALVGFSELLSPGWIGEFFAGLRAYQQYNGTTSILTLWFGHWGVLIGLALVLVAAYFFWRARSQAAGTGPFSFALCAVLAVTVVVIPTFYPTGQIVLLPAIFWLLKNGRQIWDSGRMGRLGLVGVFALIGWQWAAALGLSLASLAVGPDRVREFWLLPLGPLLLVPPALLIVLLMQAPAALNSREMGI